MRLRLQHQHSVQNLALQQVWLCARKMEWTPLSRPPAIAAGVPDPERPWNRLVPSPHDVPTGIRAAQTDHAWLIGWQYLQDGEPMRSVRLTPQIWAFEGRFSQRLLCLAGLGRPDLVLVEQAYLAWLSRVAILPGSHRHVMQSFRPTAWNALSEARRRGISAPIFAPLAAGEARPSAQVHPFPARAAHP